MCDDKCGSVCRIAPAKLNLGLRVYPKRCDGYHNIESIFQKIQLCDELSFQEKDSGSGCVVNVEGMLLPDDNTVTKAFYAFCDASGIKADLSVFLKKQIPSGAGLGGGSSDAATMLDMLNAYFKTELSDEKIASIAGQIGSDVPFFTGGSCALVSGRGEKIQAIESRKDLFFVVVYPDVHSSTKEAYGLVDEWMKKNPDDLVGWPSLDELESIYRQPVSSWSFSNSFTKPLVEKYPLIGVALETVRDAGAEFADMSGSGSTVFGVFSSLHQADAAYNRLSARWKNCSLCGVF